MFSEANIQYQTAQFYFSGNFDVYSILSFHFPTIDHVINIMYDLKQSVCGSNRISAKTLQLFLAVAGVHIT
jgi:hypothetical protein